MFAVVVAPASDTQPELRGACGGFAVRPGFGAVIVCMAVIVCVLVAVRMVVFMPIAVIMRMTMVVLVVVVVPAVVMAVVVVVVVHCPGIPLSERVVV